MRPSPGGDGPEHAPEGAVRPAGWRSCGASSATRCLSAKQLGLGGKGAECFIWRRPHKEPVTNKALHYTAPLWARLRRNDQIAGLESSSEILVHCLTFSPRDFFGHKNDNSRNRHSRFLCCILSVRIYSCVHPLNEDEPLYENYTWIRINF